MAEADKIDIDLSDSEDEMSSPQKLGSQQ